MNALMLVAALALLWLVVRYLQARRRRALVQRRHSVHVRHGGSAPARSDRRVEREEREPHRWNQPATAAFADTSASTMRYESLSSSDDSCSRDSSSSSDSSSSDSSSCSSDSSSSSSSD